jgi:conjugal transfer/entry exclusion protein
MRPRVTPLAMLLLLLSTLLLKGQSVSAQWAVIDAANLSQNTTTALQSIFSVANQLRELTHAAELVVGPDFAEDLEAIQGILTEAGGLAWELKELERQVKVLFDVKEAPASATAYKDRMYQIRCLVQDAFTTATRAQTLMRTTGRVLARTLRLMDRLGELVGGMDARQTMAQSQALITQQLAQIEVHLATFQRAQSLTQMTDPVAIEALHRINAAVMEGYPQ